MIKIENDDNFKKEIEKLIDNAIFLKKINDKFKGKKIHGQQLRIFIEDIEENIFNIFNYSLKLDNKPLKTKIVKMRGSYNNKNDFVKKNNTVTNDKIDDSENEFVNDNELSRMLKKQKDLIKSEVIEKVKLITNKYTDININSKINKLIKQKSNESICEFDESICEFDILLDLKKMQDNDLLKMIETK